MSENTEKTLAERKVGSLTLLLDFEQSMDNLKAKLLEPLTGVQAIELAKKFCNENIVQYISTNAYGALSQTNSQLVQNNLTLMAKDTPFNSVAVDLQETLKMFTTHILLHLEAAFAHVNAAGNEDAGVGLRKDVYRLDHISNVYFDDEYISPAGVENIPCGEEQGDYLLDDDIIGKAKAALERFITYTDLAETCIDRIDYFANRYRLVLGLLEMFHDRFLSYVPKPDEA